MVLHFCGCGRVGRCRFTFEPRTPCLSTWGSLRIRGTATGKQSGGITRDRAPHLSHARKTAALRRISRRVAVQARYALEAGRTFRRSSKDPQRGEQRCMRPRPRHPAPQPGPGKPDPCGGAYRRCARCVPAPSPRHERSLRWPCGPASGRSSCRSASRRKAQRPSPQARTRRRPGTRRQPGP